MKNLVSKSLLVVFALSALSMLNVDHAQARFLCGKNCQEKRIQKAKLFCDPSKQLWEQSKKCQRMLKRVGKNGGAAKVEEVQKKMRENAATTQKFAQDMEARRNLASGSPSPTPSQQAVYQNQQYDYNRLYGTGK